MSVLWTRSARLLLRSRPSVLRALPEACSVAPLRQIGSSARYRRQGSKSSYLHATDKKLRDFDDVLDLAAEGLSPQREAFRKLGIVNDTLQSDHGIINGEASSSSSIRQESRDVVSETPPSIHVRVRSVHGAQTFDVVKILSKVFGRDRDLNPVRHTFGKTSLVVQLKPLTPDEPFRFVAVYRFGSVVFFNMTARDAASLLQSIKKFGTKSIAPGFERRENFGVVIQPHYPIEDVDHDVVTGDYCVVESLDMNSVSVIANIMAQTVALDSYNDIAEELLESFSTINSTVKQSGKFTEMEISSLFRVVAQNNSIFIDMISKLGIKDRSDAAWNLTQYERVHEGLKMEFEIEHRFDNIELKLDMIQQNAKFFLEILHNQKTNTLEWIIIVLIAFECLLMCLEMSGTGSSISEAIPQLFADKSAAVPPQTPSGKT